MKSHKIAKIGSRTFVSVMDDNLGLVWILPGSLGPVRDGKGKVVVKGIIKCVKTEALKAWAVARGYRMVVEEVMEIQQ